MSSKTSSELVDIAVRCWANRLPEFQKKVDRINTRAEKKGIMATIWWEISSTTLVAPDPDKPHQKAELHIIKMRYPKIALPGDWELIGEITEGISDETGTHNFVNGFGDLSKYVSRDLHLCDHCQTNRRRVHSMILRAKETKKEVVVGSTCLKDFLGHDPAHAVFMLQFLDEFEGFGRADNDFGGSDSFYDIGSVLRSIIYATKHSGWRFISKKFARENDCPSTAGIAQTVFFDIHRKIYPDYAEVVNTPEMVQLAEQLKEELTTFGEKLGQEELSEFETKLAIIGKRCVVDMKSGFQLAILAAWAAKRILDIVNPTREAKVPSEFFGLEGQRITLTVIPDRHFEKDGQWGTKHIISGTVSGTNDRWVWFGTGSAVWRLINEKTGLVVNDEFVIQATVTAHKDDKYDKQTVLTRLKVI